MGELCGGRFCGFMVLGFCGDVVIWGIKASVVATEIPSN